MTPESELLLKLKVEICLKAAICEGRLPESELDDRSKYDRSVRDPIWEGICRNVRLMS